MRVLMTADVTGAAWTHALDLCGALRPLGVELVLAAWGGPLSSPARRAAQAACAEVHAHPEVPASERWLRDLAELVEPDVVHANDLATAHAGDAPTLVVAHACALSWWEAVRGEPAPPRWEPYQRLVAKTLARADAVVTPTRAMRAALGRHYAFAGAHVIPAGVDPRRYRQAAKLPCVVTYGNLADEAMDCATLCRAAREMPWPVLAIGEDRHGDGARVHFDAVSALGPVPRKAVVEWLGRAAIYAHPARYEPFGLAPLAAAHSGCALVLADVPTLRERWRGCARFFAPGDDAALAGAVRELAAEPDLLRRLAAAARKRALDFTLERTAAAYARLYHELAGLRTERAAPAATALVQHAPSA